jgi:hypothetical protein
VPEFDYSGALTALRDIFRADVRLEDVDVSRDRTLPTADQCPAVRLRRVRALREPLLIVAGLIGGEKLTPVFAIDCFAFSGESTEDPERQVDRLANQVEAVLRDNITIGGRVKVIRITETEFDVRPSEGGGIYAISTIFLEALQLL